MGDYTVDSIDLDSNNNDEADDGSTLSSKTYSNRIIVINN